MRLGYRPTSPGQPVTPELLVWAFDVVAEHQGGSCPECRPGYCERLGDARVLLMVQRRRWEDAGQYRRGMRREQLDLAAALRVKGLPWAEIAAVFRLRWGVTALVSMRLAHGWSQRDAAEGWCKRWPDSPKTFKNFSYWELWPGRTGYAPSLPVLIRLSELYECTVSDLLVGVGDFRHCDVVDEMASALFTCCVLCGACSLNESLTNAGSSIRPVEHSGRTGLAYAITAS